MRALTHDDRRTPLPCPGKSHPFFFVFVPLRLLFLGRNFWKSHQLSPRSQLFRGKMGVAVGCGCVQWAHARPSIRASTFYSSPLLYYYYYYCAFDSTADTGHKFENNLNLNLLGKLGRTTIALLGPPLYHVGDIVERFNYNFIIMIWQILFRGFTKIGKQYEVSSIRSSQVFSSEYLAPVNLSSQ